MPPTWTRPTTPRRRAWLTLVPGVLRLRVGVVSTVGNYREHNEDNFFLPGRNAGGGRRRRRRADREALRVPRRRSTQLYTFLVADGMGGQQAGEKASRMAVEIIPKELARRLGAGEEDDKVDPARRSATRSPRPTRRSSASRASRPSSPTWGRPSSSPCSATTASTSPASATRGPTGSATAGSSSSPRTTRWPTPWSRPGRSPTEELPNHKFKNVLYLYLGSKDARGGPEDVRVLDVRPGDRFLLATDGLTGVVEDDELARIVAECDDPPATASVADRPGAGRTTRRTTSPCLVIHAV